MKERFNIKNSVYLNMSLNNALLEICEETGWGYQKTLRYLLNIGIETYNNKRR